MNSNLPSNAGASGPPDRHPETEETAVANLEDNQKNAPQWLFSNIPPPNRIYDMSKRKIHRVTVEMDGLFKDWTPANWTTIGIFLIPQSKSAEDWRPHYLILPTKTNEHHDNINLSRPKHSSLSENESGLPLQVRAQVFIDLRSAREIDHHQLAKTSKVIYCPSMESYSQSLPGVQPGLHHFGARLMITPFKFSPKQDLVCSPFLVRIHEEEDGLGSSN
jgi:hypothetical protein